MVGECVYYLKGRNSVCIVVVKSMEGVSVKGEGVRNSSSLKTT